MIETAWSGPKDPELNAAISTWVKDQIWPGQDRTFGPCACLAMFRDRRIVAGLVFHNWEPDAGIAEYSGAALPGANWMTSDILKAAAGYLFDGLRCQMIYARVRPENKKLQRLLELSGHKRHVIPRFAGRDRDGLIYTLTDDDWKVSRLNRG